MPDPRQWKEDPPDDCPIPRSIDHWGLEFTGRYATYTDADTWYPSWAGDGTLYSPFTDGSVGRFASWSKGELAMTGLATIDGDDPFDLSITVRSTTVERPYPYGGRYPSALLAHNGKVYLGTYCLDEDTSSGLNWEFMGPFVGFRTSSDGGKTWDPNPHTPASPLFGESGKDGAKVRLGAPHIVDFGRDMEYSPDGYAYLVGHGGSRREANVSWISGDEVNIARVQPSPHRMNDPASWQFFAGHDSEGQPIWADSMDALVPAVEWNDHMGCTTISYNPHLGRYLMAVTDGWPTISAMTSYILEAERVTGPWRMAAYLPDFGDQAYFLTFPTKFMAPDLTMWLTYSANFTNDALGINVEYRPPNPPGSRYAMVMAEVRLLPSA